MEKYTYLLFLIAFSAAGCQKSAVVIPVKPKADTVRKTVNTNHVLPWVTNPYYWYNGSTGTGEVVVNCNDCTGLIKTAKYWPFLFDPSGVGKLKYNAVAGDTLFVNICPRGTQLVKVVIYNKDLVVFS